PHELPSFPTRRSSDLTVVTAVKAGPVILSTDPPGVQMPLAPIVPAHALKRPAGSPLIAAARPAATSSAVRPRNPPLGLVIVLVIDRKSTRLNSSHLVI